MFFLLMQMAFEGIDCIQTSCTCVVTKMREGAGVTFTPSCSFYNQSHERLLRTGTRPVLGYVTIYWAVVILLLA
ncbi:hypothetical protein XcmpCFBP7700_00775 [Xanthomonas campestris]|nr:hypothetical protein XcmpCFBP7700_00775 [Xanthomonas campestris]